MKEVLNNHSRFALSLILAFALMAFAAFAQKKTKAQDKSLEEKLAASRAEVINAANDYKASLEKLIALLEKDVVAARETVERRKKLFEENIISRRELEESQRQLAEAEDKVLDARRQITEADSVIAEVKAAEMIDKLKPAATGAFISTGILIRFTGKAGWSIAEAEKVQGFFSSRFGRALPVSAFGQSATHDRLGYDHRNAMDVAVHPDSAEGQVLMAYLRNAGIPFLAFRQALAGSSTGPHIHIGYPSKRFAR
ncbi:MAG: hypothetical protein AB1631_10055 [Acidobacteriota bacterium]